MRAAGTMQDEQQPLVRLEGSGLEAVEEVMGGDGDQRHGHHQIARKTNEGSEQNHGQTEATDNPKHAPSRVECPCKTDHGEFQHDKPNAASHQKLLQSGRGMLPSVKIGARSREKKKCWRAEVGYPTNQEVETPGLVDVFRFEGNIAYEVARMIEGHEHHGEAADEIDGGYSPITPIGTLEGGDLNGNLPI